MTQFTVGAVADDLSLDRPRYASPEVKNEVFERDGGKCRQCDATDNLEYDHIIPWVYGGANTADNIQLLCMPCNRAKSRSLPDALTEHERVILSERLILEKAALKKQSDVMKSELHQLREFQAIVENERTRRGGKSRSAPVIPVSDVDIAWRVQRLGQERRLRMLDALECLTNAKSTDDLAPVLAARHELLDLLWAQVESA